MLLELGQKESLPCLGPGVSFGEIKGQGGEGVDHPEVAQAVGTGPEGQIVLRVAKVESVDPDILVEIEEALSKEFNNARSHAKKLGGVDKIAATLNTLSSEEAEKTLTELAVKDPELADAVRASMFTFNDLLRIDVYGLQALLKRAAPSDLKAALRGAEPTITEHILSAMSKRASEVMIEDVSAGGKLPLSVIQAARSQLAALARQMIADGKISLLDDPLLTKSA
jgi:flagellar motor switch protein FliG